MSRSQLRQETLRIREARKYRPSAQHGPRAPPTIDVTLNALIQLIPWRLSVSRSLVSIVDKDIQYIIAESTKTSDIEDLKGPLVPEDGVWLGCNGSLRKEDSLCQYTMATPLPATGFAIFQIPDIALEKRFHHIPAVSQPPGIRYYAGTPLITSDGLRIGTLCVLDTEPRPALDGDQIHFLGLMANSVMQHLNMQTEMRQQRRFNKMTRGLTDLVTQDTPSLDHEDSDDDEEDTDEQAPVSYFPGGSDTPFEKPSEPQCHIARPTSDSKTHRQIFMVAAELLRTSLESDLVLLAENFEDLRTWSTSQDSRVGLSCSATKAPHMQQVLSFEHPEQMIKTISQRWPLGKIWVRDDSNNFVGLEDSRYRHFSVFAGLRRMSSHSSDSQPDADECEWLANWLPSARQVIFVPLWDHSTVHTASACFIMSQHNLPVFNAKIEVPYIRAFLNSLSVICGQLTLQVADQQKDQLLSSISHELRSPLHGIIAAVEMLSTTNLDHSQADLCENIDVCSQTLLDTMSLVMDHAMVNSFVEGRSKNPFQKNAGLTVHAGSSLHLESTCNVAALCEEGVDITKSAFSGLNKVTGVEYASAESRPPKAVIEIDFRASRADWLFTCRPGVIRRLVMNLVSNSMKYTGHGTITVDLTQGDNTDDADRETYVPIILTVTDTGKGMSNDFLKNGLFEAFSQESVAAPGLGLGMSIVRASVRSLQGTIDVSSKLGQGTKITVTFMASRSSHNGSPAAARPDLLADLNPSTGPPHKTYRTFGPRVDGSARHRQTLDVYLHDWWLYEPVQDETAMVDLTFVCENDIHLPLPPSQHYIVLTDLPLTEIMNKKRPNQAFTYLRAPFGPKSLSKAIAAASGSRLSSTATVTTVKDIQASPDTGDAPSAPTETTQHDRPSLPPPALSASPTITTHSQLPPQPSVNTISTPASMIGTPSPTSPLAHHEKSATKTRLKRPTDYFANPAHHAHSDTAILTKSKHQPTGVGPRKSSVLCVDDNGINLKLLTTYCSKLGFDRIATAMNGLEAVEAVMDTSLGTAGADGAGQKLGAPGGHPPYEVIFMDLTMPVCDGFEATRRIREFERRRRVLVMPEPAEPSKTASVDSSTGESSDPNTTATDAPQQDTNLDTTTSALADLNLDPNSTTQEPPDPDTTNSSGFEDSNDQTQPHPAEPAPSTNPNSQVTRIPDPRELNISEEASPRSIIIAITALASEADQKKAFAAGVDHFVTKPLRFKDLRGLLGELGVL